MGLQHLRTVFGDSILTVPGFTGALWIFHLAIAAIWAGDLDRAEELTRQSERQPHPPRWMGWVPAWLRGLAAEAAGAIGRPACTWMRRSPGSLTICRSTGPTSSPITRESRLSSTTSAAARRSLDAARQLYRVLGAVPYLDAAERRPQGRHVRFARRGGRAVRAQRPRA